MVKSIKSKEFIMKLLSEEKNIALSPLSNQLGFPEKEGVFTTMKAIIDYIINNKNNQVTTYKNIFLYVVNLSEFNLYKEQLTYELIK